MNKFLSKVKITYRSLKGYFFKFKVDLTPFHKIPSLDREKNTNNNNEIIITLTSYGRRVKSTVYYSIISILKQTIKPDKIILWLDNISWNEHNLPKKIIRLKTKGLEIKFCEDIKSYKKLIPALKDYPHAVLITIDDDLIYNNKLIERLIIKHKEEPESIISTQARYPEIKFNNSFTPYNNWIDYIPNAKIVMPLGGSGTLYPPNSFHKDVTNIKLIQKLCPNADDLWFWIMGILNNNKYIVIDKSDQAYYSFDTFYQFFHKYSALNHINRKENKNDEQLRNILNYYNLKPNDIIHT